MRRLPDRKTGLRTALVVIVVGGIVLPATALHRCGGLGAGTPAPRALG